MFLEEPSGKNLVVHRGIPGWIPGRIFGQIHADSYGGIPEKISWVIFDEIPRISKTANFPLPDIRYLDIE